MSEEPKIVEKPAGKPEKPAATRGRGRSMTTKEKAEAVALWQSGEVTILDLAKKYGRDPATINKVLADAKAVKGGTAAKVVEAAAKKVEESIASDAEVIAKRIRETKDEHYKLSRGIVMAVAKELHEHGSGGKDLANRAPTLKAYESAMKVLKMAREERFAVLGILDGDNGSGDEIPDLIVQELSAEDVAVLRSMGGEEGIDDVGGEDEEGGDLKVPDDSLDIEEDDE